MFKFLCTMSSYRIRYAEKNLPGITYRLLGVTENKNTIILTFKSVKVGPQDNVTFTPRNSQYS